MFSITSQKEIRERVLRNVFEGEDKISINADAIQTEASLEL